MRGESNVSLDHLAVAGATVRPERRPDRERARPTRVLRSEEARIRPRIVRGGKVGRADVERPGETGGVPKEGESAVVRHVQPLVTIRDHRVRALHTGRQMADRGGEPREESESTVDVKPGAVLRREVGHSLYRVKIARVDLARVRDHDGRAVQLSQPRLEGLGVEAPGPVASESFDIALTHPEHADRLDGAGMDVAARENQ